MSHSATRTDRTSSVPPFQSLSASPSITRTNSIFPTKSLGYPSSMLKIFMPTMVPRAQPHP